MRVDDGVRSVLKRPIGFSTGALAKGDFRRALALLRDYQIDVVELSALRIEELAPLISALPQLELQRFRFVSFHAPSRFGQELEERVIADLGLVAARGYPIIVHPDVLFTPKLWSRLGNKLLIENMDRRKEIGRNVDELIPVFEQLPEAQFCFDIGHARQIDPSMREAQLLLHALGDRLAEVHISEVDADGQHRPISPAAAKVFQFVAKLIPEQVPVIVESVIDAGQAETEIGCAREALSM